MILLSSRMLPIAIYFVSKILFIYLHELILHFEVTQLNRCEKVHNAVSLSPLFLSLFIRSNHVIKLSIILEMFCEYIHIMCVCPSPFHYLYFFCMQMVTKILHLGFFSAKVVSQRFFSYQYLKCFLIFMGMTILQRAELPIYFTKER